MTKGIRVCYKVLRRRGFRRIDAYERAVQMDARLRGHFAIMNAADWKLDPVKLVRGY